MTATTTAGKGATDRVARLPTGALRRMRGDARWGPRQLSALPALILLLLPCVMWTGFTGSRMTLGGDASLLFFADPMAWLRHSSTTLVSAGIGGYNAQSQFVPFCLLLALFRAVGLNAQGVTLGAVLAMGFLGVRATCLELLGTRTTPAYVGAAIAATTYLSTPLVAETQWSALLPRFLWLGLLPVLAALLLQHQRVGGTWRVALGATLVALLAPAWTDVPGALPALLALVVVLVVAVTARSTRLHVGRLMISALVVAAVNAFWIVPGVLAVPLGGGQIAGATSAAGVDDARAIVSALAPSQRVQAALDLRLSHSFLKTFGSVATATETWPQRLAVLGLLPLALIVGAMAVGRSRRLLAHLAAATAPFLYFQVVNITVAGPALYTFLLVQVPGWTAVRNFYAAWPVAYVFVLALAAGVASERLLHRCAEHADEAARGCLAAPSSGLTSVRSWTASSAVSLALGVMAALVLYDLPFYAGTIFRLNYSSSIGSSRVITGLSPHYRKVLEFISASPAGNVATLPLLRPAWTAVTDGGDTGLYLGISPINYLTNRSDYDGLDSFQSGTSPGLKEAVRGAVARSDSRDFASLLGTLGVHYLVVNTAMNATTGYFGLQAAPSPMAEQAFTDELVARYAHTLLFAAGPWQVRGLSAPVRREPVEAVQRAMPAAAARPLADVLTTEATLREVAGACDLPPTISLLSPGRSAVTAKQNLAGCRITLDTSYQGGWHATLAHGGGEPTDNDLALIPLKDRDGGLAFDVPRTAVAATRVVVTAPVRRGRRREPFPGISLRRVRAATLEPTSALRPCAGSVTVRGDPAHGADILPGSALRDCTLVLTQAYADGWSAVLSGRGPDLRLLPRRVNGGLLGFDLPHLVSPGQGIRVNYRPNVLLTSTGWFSGVALILVLAPVVGLPSRLRSRIRPTRPRKH